MPEAGAAAAGAEERWVQVLEGSTFMLSDPRGDVHQGGAGGLFHEDTRYLSRFVLSLEGAIPAVLSSGTVDYYAAAFFLTNPELEGLPPGSVSLQRFRFVGEGLNEVVVLESHLDRELRLRIRVSCGVDFADLFEVKERGFRKRGRASVRAEESALLFEYEHGDFRAGTRIHSTERCVIEGQDLVFDVTLAPRGRWKTRLQLALRRGDEVHQPITEEARAASRALQQWRDSSREVERWREQLPTLNADRDLVGLVYDQSVVDLAALRLYADVEGNEYALPAAGLPWFMAIFGRDTLITSYQAIHVGPELARGALYALAGLQGTKVDDFNDEEPGKVLHEIRFGELTTIGETPHRPYYGSVDATPLFLILLSEYWRWTGDDETALALRSNAEWALAWIDVHGDADGDGYVEYRTRSPSGLLHQGWKDSTQAILFGDGRPAVPPIALSEVQGYVYDAKLRMAELAEAVWGAPEVAAGLREQAAGLAERFDRDFWLDGHYAVALDAEKRPVDSTTSNMGHLLWSGIVPGDRAADVVRVLLSPAMFSGWGVRTMSRRDVGYNPIAYHGGTVWPHDNSLICAGLARYGFRAEANRIAVAMFEAAGHTAYRLPEVFAGYPREESRFPVRYPTASSPQAWATAAPFLWLRLALGLEPGEDGPRVDPRIPEDWGHVSFRGVQVRGARYDVAARREVAEVTPAAPTPAS